MNELAIAYGFIWAAVFAYMILTTRRLGQVHAEIDELRRRLGPAK
jgi:CcmD family protein